MVKVCDAIMGSGKTSATIGYINAHPEKKFLYITPYLPEAERIKNNCPQADFVEPSDRIPEFLFSKAMHTLGLIRQRRNITSTHQCLMYYTPETIQLLKENGYCIIIDEEVTVLQADKQIAYSDIQLAIDAGYVYEAAPDEYRRTDKPYDGGVFSHMFRLMASRPLVYNKSKQNGCVWYWLFSKELLEAVDDVFVLTYLFKNSEMDLFMQINNIPYVNIGIRRTEGGGYIFSDKPEYVPDYVYRLKDMIHIDDGQRINSVGDMKHALSMNWYKSKTDGVNQVRRNLMNYFQKRSGDIPAQERMCGTYKEYWGRIRGKGYWNSSVVFNAKATNQFSHCRALAYPINLFANGDIVHYYASKGVIFDNDHYALSTMIQWIWRSAIRNGEEISLYLPSKRMRDLLTEWIEKTSKGIS